MTLRERFHAMSGTDPYWYTFQTIWSRVWIDKGIGYGLYIAETRAGVRDG